MNTVLKGKAELNLKSDFPVLQQTNRGKPLVYLDSASSTQKPTQVIDAISNLYKHDYANIHRGIYELSERSTSLFEGTRSKVKLFLNAASENEIVFVSSTTAGINLVASTISQLGWQAGDEVILSEMEHHANIVPWYLLKERLGIVLKVIPVTDEGALDMSAYRKLFSPRTKLVSVTHASNVLGTVNPVKEITQIAHEHGALVLLDGAQAVPHLPVDVQAIDCDFYVFSSHKLYGPTGAGVLYGKESILNKLPPYQGGGSMIETVSFEKITFAKPPLRFEAGTPDIAGVVGLGAAIDYLTSINMSEVHRHEQAMLAYTEEKLKAIPGLRMIGTCRPKLAVLSFVFDHIHPHDLGTVLDNEGIAIRAGHHCAMPLMKRFNIPAAARASFGIYNNEQDADALINAIQTAARLFA